MPCEGPAVPTQLNHCNRKKISPWPAIPKIKLFTESPTEGPVIYSLAPCNRSVPQRKQSKDVPFRPQESILYQALQQLKALFVPLSILPICQTTTPKPHCKHPESKSSSVGKKGILGKHVPFDRPRRGISSRIYSLSIQSTS